MSVINIHRTHTIPEVIPHQYKTLSIFGRMSTVLFIVSQVKPTTVQVNLSSCCVVPKELTTFAQQNDVQVLTHNDPAGEDGCSVFLSSYTVH